MSKHEHLKQNKDAILKSVFTPLKRRPSELAPATGYRAFMRQVESLVEASPCRIVVIVQREDEVSVRDNSGVQGLCGEPLMHKTIALLEELFESDYANGSHNAGRK